MKNRYLTSFFFLAISVFLISLLVSAGCFFLFNRAKPESAFFVKGLGREVSERLNYEDISIQEKIRLSSLIFLTKHEIRNGGVRNIIIEILKQTKFSEGKYRVGDYFHRLDSDLVSNMDYGEGEIVFFSGPGVEFARSVSYSNNALRTDNGMSLDEFRELVRENQNKTDARSENP